MQEGWNIISPRRQGWVEQQINVYHDVVSEEGKNRKSLISHKGSGKRRSNPEDLKMTKDMMREIRYSRTG
jgi:hypothetical protein